MGATNEASSIILMEFKIFMAINKVLLLGNLGKDPEVRFSNDQKPIATLSIATGEKRKNASGEWVEHTEWHKVVCFGKTAELCQKYLKKGRQVFIEGTIRTRKWQDKEGKDRYTTEILCNSLQFVGSKGDNDSSSPYGNTAPMDIPDLPSADDLASSSLAVNFEDDDIPF